MLGRWAFVLELRCFVDCYVSILRQGAVDKAAHRALAWQAACSQAEAAPLRLAEQVGVKPWARPLALTSASALSLSARRWLLFGSPQVSRLLAVKAGLVDGSVGASLGEFDLATQLPQVRGVGRGNEKGGG